MSPIMPINHSFHPYTPRTVQRPRLSQLWFHASEAGLPSFQEPNRVAMPNLAYCFGQQFVDRRRKNLAYLTFFRRRLVLIEGFDVRVHDS